MSDMDDSLFLDLNRKLGLIPEKDVRSAQDALERDRGKPGARRSLVQILRSSGVLTPELEVAFHEGKAAPASPPPSGRGLEELLGDIEDKLSAPLAPAVSPKAPTLLLPATPGRFAQRPEGGEIRGDSSWEIATKPIRPSEVEAADANPENRLGPFVRLQEVGRGGMGRVYRAWDNTVGRVVALKVIETEDPDSRERFVREAQVAGQLHHSAIATVFQAGEHKGRGYLAMQFIEGKPVDGSHLSIKEILLLIREVAGALAYAHQKGVVHRDIKPGNLMVDRSGRVFITDFGLAKLKLDDTTSQISITGTILGTPQFMSPEQAKGEGNKVDARSDIYSLGATLYSLLAGRPPFIDRAVGPLLVKVIQHAPPSLSKFNPLVSPELVSVVERAMAKDPSHRYPSAQAFGDELERLIREERYSGRFGLAKQLARRWVPVALAGILFGLGARVVLSRLAAFRNPEAPAPARPAIDPTALLYQEALSSLEALEKGELSTQDLRARIQKEVLPRLDRFIRLRPGTLQAEVTRIRALYVAGELEAVRGGLKRFGLRYPEDYRLPFLSCLLALDQALEKPPPLPALEAPGPEWESPPSSLGGSWLEYLKAASAGPGEIDVPAEHQRDVLALKALSALSESRWAEAADLLGEVVRISPRSIYKRAWCRSAYLDRRFSAVAASTGAGAERERIGAQMALGLGSPEPISRLGALLPELKGDSRAQATLYLALARLKAESAADPAKEIRAGLELARTQFPEDRSLQGALLGSALRVRALQGRDQEEEYTEALKLLGDLPSGWVYSLAAIEGRIGRGALALRKRKDARPFLEDAIRMSNELTQRAPEWTAPRLLRTEARLKLGQLEDAWAELARLAEGPTPPLRATLLSSALWLEQGERHRRAHQPYLDDAKMARKFAVQALGSSPGHAEALALLGSASLLLAQEAAERGEDAGALLAGAVDSLDQALGGLEGMTEALLRRAQALFLQSGVGRTGEGDARTLIDRALGDVDRVLLSVPDSLAAHHLRGILQFSRRKPEEALKDWKWIRTQDPEWNASELDLWIKQAEARRGGGK